MITQISLDSSSQMLEIILDDGQCFTLSAHYLRIHAMDAWSRRERLKNGYIRADSSIRIDNILPLGGCALNINFSDGHKKAIYPHRYLETLALSVDN